MTAPDISLNGEMETMWSSWMAKCMEVFFPLNTSPLNICTYKHQLTLNLILAQHIRDDTVRRSVTHWQILYGGEWCHVHIGHPDAITR